MGLGRVRTAVLLLAGAGFLRASPPADGFPHADEWLLYTVNWPSGLSLGDASLQARRNGDRWSFEFTLDAAVPGFAVKDRYRSTASAGFCSLEFASETSHGAFATREKTTFDYRKGVALRVPARGRRTRLPTGACARDALNFVFYARRELAHGRLPRRQPVILDAPYHVQFEYAGVRSIAVNEIPREADCVLVSSRGAGGALDFEVFFARDAGRTPLVVRVPLALGFLSLELARESPAATAHTSTPRPLQ
jgi:hypothetical protein